MTWLWGVDVSTRRVAFGAVREDGAVRWRSFEVDPRVPHGRRPSPCGSEPYAPSDGPTTGRHTRRTAEACPGQRAAGKTPARSRPVPVTVHPLAERVDPVAQLPVALWATAFLASGAATVAERKAEADLECSVYGKDDEARYEALKAVTRVLETRASIGMSLLRSYGRAAG